MLTDLASVPLLFCSLIGSAGPNLQAAIVYDHLYVAWFQAGIAPNREMRRFADELMFLAMCSAGMRCKARLIFWAVRLFGWWVFKSAKQTPVVVAGNQLPRCCRDGNHEDSEEQASSA